MTKTVEIAKTHGGKRAKSGRKPIDDKKKTVSIYPRESRIEALGGEEELKKFLDKTIEKEYAKIILAKD